jgi:uncharacterized membrane protein YeaQ/YmgE (transglycosylase-associated protein family)
MNNKGQFDFLDEFEFNPLSLAAGIVCGIITFFVTSQTSMGLFYKIIVFTLGLIIGYIVFDKIAFS